MASETIYEIVYLDGAGDDALVIERTQLLSVDGVLRLSNADGSETRCEGVDVKAVISSTPSLGESARGSKFGSVATRSSLLSCHLCWCRSWTAPTLTSVT